MKYTYEIVKGSFDNDLLKRTDENGVVAWIPMDPTKSDYQRYLNPEADQPIGGNK